MSLQACKAHGADCGPIRIKLIQTPVARAEQAIDLNHGLLTEDVIRSGSFASVKELVDDINAYLTERNANPQPYKWTAKGEALLEKISRARAALDKVEAA